MTQSYLVTTIVVNWNGRVHLDKCLSSLLAQTYEPQDVILVDNGSTDGSADYVAAQFPSVKVLRLQVNAGFAAANNAAIRQSAGAFVALLNNDAYAEPDWLATMVKAARADTAIGMVACKLLFADKPNMINSTGLALDWAGFCWDWRGGQPDDPSETQVEERFGPTGGAALYRRTMLDEIGLLDEEFFAYEEDADLAWRAQRAGWRCVYVPGARAYHVTSATAGSNSPFKNYWLGRTKVQLFAKNMPGGWRIGWLAILLLYDGLALGYGLLTRGDWAALRGRLAGLRGLPHMLRQRNRTLTRTHAYLRLIHPLEPPWKIPARFGHLAMRGQHDASRH